MAGRRKVIELAMSEEDLAALRAIQADLREAERILAQARAL